MKENEKIFQVQVGDVVIIRQWDDMRSEFGENEYHNIACDATFTYGMKEFCGQKLYVKELLNVKGTRFTCSTTANGQSVGNVRHWTFSTDMIEKESIFESNCSIKYEDFF